MRLKHCRDRQCFLWFCLQGCLSSNRQIHYSKKRQNCWVCWGIALRLLYSFIYCGYVRMEIIDQRFIFEQSYGIRVFCEWQYSILFYLIYKRVVFIIKKCIVNYHIYYLHDMKHFLQNHCSALKSVNSKEKMPQLIA